uniref:Zinc transporter ZIP3 n=1 Tax=Panagrellus redivivus TaxID=6233 RepID=A0A7E4WB20_PANRE
MFVVVVVIMSPRGSEGGLEEEFQTKMDITLLKIILIACMGVISFLAGTAPIKIYELLKRNSSPDGISSLIISLMSCFAGGVILGVCLLDMLPDAREEFEKFQTLTDWHYEYPFLEILIGVGFFIVYFLEEVIDKLCVHEHQNERQRRMTITLAPHTLDHPDVEDESVTSSASSQQPITKIKLDLPSTKEERKALMSAITFVLALCIHGFLEGFAFGVQDTTMSVANLFFGIIVHKALVNFSVGMSLMERLSGRRWVVAALICVLAVISPIGGALGLLIQSSNINEVPKTGISTVLSCFSIGCFFFITFFDILAVERKNNHNNLLQWCCSVGGFFVVAGMIYLSHQ